ncbi:MAG: hypothetical protein JXP34_02850 [Planctomycetes bacterium]|nr:hypothetical protein [Planctomycetota bacterium]
MQRSRHRSIGATMAWFALSLSWLAPATAGETRYHGCSKKATGAGGAVTPIAATYFGETGVEQIIDAGFSADGRVIAFGNAWGPSYPGGPGMRAIGADRSSTTSPYKDASKKAVDEDHPAMAGFLVRFSPALDRFVGGFRFGAGLATITRGLVAGDGVATISGRCAPEFRIALADIAKSIRVVTPPEEAKSGGGELYLARVPAGADAPDRVIVFEKAEAPSAAWERRVGRRPGVHAEFRGKDEIVLLAYDTLYVLSTESGDLRELGSARGGVLWAADPRDGSAYVGGDENTRTGREPWRRPFLRKFDGKGGLVWEIWRWDAKRVGTDAYRLVSDSSVRHVVPHPDGDLLIAGWSDGGNSVFNRQPRDLDAPADYKRGFIDSLWGAGVGSFARIMRIDGKEPAFEAGTIWCSFLPERNKPNSLFIDDLAVLDDGRVAAAGRSATALIESPDAWSGTYLQGASGTYLAIFRPDLGGLIFSSALPAVRGKPTIAVRGTRILIAASAETPGPGRQPIAPGGAQPKHGGEMDGYLLLIETAGASSARPSAR